MRLDLESDQGDFWSQVIHMGRTIKLTAFSLLIIGTIGLLINEFVAN